MDLSLPERPSLRFLKVRAKQLLKAFKNGDSDACSTLQRLHRFRTSSREEIMRSSVSLQEVQHALVLSYGFKKWEDLIFSCQPNTKEDSMKHHIDFTDLDYKGNGHTQDSFSLAVYTAARWLGKDVTYEDVAALAGNVFAPGIHRRESCTSWWHVIGWMGSRAHRELQHIGLRIEMFPIPCDPIDCEGSPAEVAERSLRVRRLCAPVFRKAFDAGAIVMRPAGWPRTADDGAFIPWCWWGFITHAGDDGDIRATVLAGGPDLYTGRKNQPLQYIDEGWAVYPTKAIDGEYASSRRVLQLAVARIRSKAPFAGDDETLFGLFAVDSWIEKMQSGPFCPECAERSHGGYYGCAALMATTVSRFSETASVGLSRIKNDLPGPAVPHVARAESEYHRIVRLLEPAITDESEFSYRKILGDLAKQKEHASKVLVPVREAYSRVADSLEAALKLME